MKYYSGLDVSLKETFVIPIPITRQTDGQQWKKSHTEVSKIARFKWH